MRSEGLRHLLARRLVLTASGLITMASLSLGPIVPAERTTVSAATAAAPECIAQGTLRDGASGVLVCASAQRLVVKLSGSGALVTIPLSGPTFASTTVCRAEHGCNATWRDLHVGDVLDTGVSPSAGHPLTLFVDANLTIGYGKVTALTIHTLTLALTGRGGAPGMTRTLSLASSTPVSSGKTTTKGTTQGLRVGNTVFFTASGDSPYRRTTRYWALVLVKR